MNNIVTLTREEILTKEHDFINMGIETARSKMSKPHTDDMAAAYDFFIYAEAITDFATELLSSEDV